MLFCIAIIIPPSESGVRVGLALAIGAAGGFVGVIAPTAPVVLVSVDSWGVGGGNEKFNEVSTSHVKGPF